MVFVRTHGTHHGTEFLFDRAGGRPRGQQTQHVGGLRLDLQQLLRVALLHMARQVVLPAEALGTVLAQEVLPAGVDHHVAPDILPGVETAITVVTRVFLFLGATG